MKYESYVCVCEQSLLEGLTRALFLFHVLVYVSIRACVPFLYFSSSIPFSFPSSFPAPSLFSLLLLCFLWLIAPFFLVFFLTIICPLWDDGKLFGEKGFFARLFSKGIGEDFGAEDRLLFFTLIVVALLPLNCLLTLLLVLFLWSIYLHFLTLLLSLLSLLPFVIALPVVNRCCCFLFISLSSPLHMERQVDIFVRMHLSSCFCMVSWMCLPFYLLICACMRCIYCVFCCCFLTFKMGV